MEESYRILSVVGVIVTFMLTSGTAEQENCGRHFSSSSGVIQSPNYPRPYPANSSCIWPVSVGGSPKSITVKFSAFKLQGRTEKGECIDYVSVHCVSNDQSTLNEGTFCGTSIPSSIVIAGQSLEVQFISDAFSSDNDTGFSLDYNANFEEFEAGSSSPTVSQATAGIVAAIFCAVLFIGVGTLRCIMLGACSFCNGPDGRGGNNREVVGTHESYSFQADFPPSYSTVMEHPERFPTPDASPLTAGQRQQTVTNGPQRTSRPFSIQSNDNSSSGGGDDDDDDDDDDDSTPPPPYPGIVVSEDQVYVDACQSRGNQTNVDDSNFEPAEDDRALQSSSASTSAAEFVRPTEEENPQTSPASAQEAITDRDNNREELELGRFQNDRLNVDSSTEEELRDQCDASVSSNQTEITDTPEIQTVYSPQVGTQHNNDSMTGTTHL